MSRHTFEEKLKIVFQVKNGKPILQISRECHIRQGMILEWVRKYDGYGRQGLHKQPNIRATPEFKEEVVRFILEKHIPLAQVVLQYGVSCSALESWVRIVRLNGYEALHQQKKCGRPTKVMGPPKKQEPKTELEKLQAENARLRAENALLKKVKALVEEREAHERMIGRKPSRS
ncbi:helix-turn-helix domain-containing protein [Dysgonomonas sp. GY75]|uniref:helix-turn-helix domain-containing protein n=1 Tax=Dysgonomonas sp. GY75 TaxID=2780419 RepID=UPI0018841E4D|nr:helix-turn-helix domain-containing protein [Dysgonomonas sp. GY75]MBF0647926.1 helix-turn-helix domain-containing protein [Dysgonomonas sp. GY75]